MRFYSELNSDIAKANAISLDEREIAGFIELDKDFVGILPDTDTSKVDLETAKSTAFTYAFPPAWPNGVDSVMLHSAGNIIGTIRDDSKSNDELMTSLLTCYANAFQALGYDVIRDQSRNQSNDLVYNGEKIGGVIPLLDQPGTSVSSYVNLADCSHMFELLTDSDLTSEELNQRAGYVDVNTQDFFDQLRIEVKNEFGSVEDFTPDSAITDEAERLRKEQTTNAALTN